MRDYRYTVVVDRQIPLSTAGSGPCALARPRSSRCRVGARVRGKGPRVRLERSAARVVELRSGGNISAQVSRWFLQDGQVESRRDPFDGQVSLVVDFAIPPLRRGAETFIVIVIGHPYLRSLLRLLLTMSSYFVTVRCLACLLPLGKVGLAPLTSVRSAGLCREVISGANSGDLAEKVTSGINLGDLAEEPISGTNLGDFTEELISGTNPGDLAEKMTSGINLEDLAEEPISGTNPGDFTEGLISGINPRDLAEKVTSCTNLGDLFEEPISGTNLGDFAEGLISGINPGNLVEEPISDTNLGDLAEKVISGTNPGDLAERVVSGTNPGDLAEGLF
ncbi:hypothetical protein GW17_00055353, partial [Ensete ventricosum]